MLWKYSATVVKMLHFPELWFKFPSVWQNFLPYVLYFFILLTTNFPPVAKFPRNEIYQMPHFFQACTRWFSGMCDQWLETVLRTFGYPVCVKASEYMVTAFSVHVQNLFEVMIVQLNKHGKYRMCWKIGDA